MICCPLAYISSLTQFYLPYFAQNLGYVVTCGVKVDAGSHLKLLSTSILDTYNVIEHIDMLSMGIQYHPYTVIPTLLGSDFGLCGHLWSQNDVIMSWLRLTATSNCFQHPYWTYTKYLSTLICCPLAYGSSLTQFYPSYLAQILGFWVTCGVKIMWLCHGWGWQPPQTASHIHIRHLECVWEHWYAIYGHTVSSLHSYTHTTSWLRFLSSGSLVESKWCDYVMVEAESHLKPLPTSILDIYKVFEYIDMLSRGIWLQPYTVIPTLLGSDLGVLGHLWSQNDVISSGLMLTATSNCFLPPF